MKKILFISTFIFIVGCEKELKLQEVGRNVYYFNKESELFIVDDEFQKKVETLFSEPMVKNKFTLDKNIGWDGLDLKSKVIVKYIEGECHFNVKLSKNKLTSNFENTSTYKRIKNDSNTLVIIELREEDNFLIKKIEVSHSKHLLNTFVDSNSVTGFNYGGEVSISENLFKKVKSIDLSTSIDDL
jgi:hypothetical protein